MAEIGMEKHWNVPNLNMKERWAENVYSTVSLIIHSLSFLFILDYRLLESLEEK